MKDTEYDFIGFDYEGRIVGVLDLGDWGKDEDIIIGDELLGNIQRLIDYKDRQKVYYSLFYICIKDCGEAYLQFAYRTIKEMRDIENKIEYGKKYLKGENTGLIGKDSSEKLPELETELKRKKKSVSLLNKDVVNLITFWDK